MRLSKSYGLMFFMGVTTGHFLEHLIQAYQFFVLGWPRKESLGLLGVWKPWLVHSEWLHFSLAVFMFLGLWALLDTMPEGPTKQWWRVAAILQSLHLVEHIVPMAQAITGNYLYGATKPMSLLELWIPRLELHFVYNCIVMTPIVVSMFYLLRDKESNKQLV